eukprot:Gb_16875 [translate_table: standard]
MAHPKVVGRVSYHLMRVTKTICADMQQTLHSVRGIVSSQTGSIGPSDSGGDCADSRPSHGDRSHIPWYFSNDEAHHMSVEDLRSLYFKCRDYIHGTYVATRECGYHTNYMDFTYEMEHGQALRFLESSVATSYERVGGAGPSEEFEEPWVDLTIATPEVVITYPDTAPIVSQTHDSMNSPLDIEVTTCPDMTPVVSKTHDLATSPLGVEVTTCPDTTPKASVPKSVLGSQTHDPTTSPLGLEPVGIDGHHVIGRQSRQTDEDLEDGNRSQRLRREIDTEDIVPPRDSVSS